MTNADVQKLIAHASSLGRTVSDYQAVVFLGARELVQRDPSNKNALAVVANFNEFMATGVRPWSFAEFVIGDFYTDEERTQMKAAR